MMNPNTDVFTAKRRRLLLPWETGFAALVFGSTPSSSSISREPLLEQIWDTEFLRAASTTETEPVVEVTEQGDEILCGVER